MNLNQIARRYDSGQVVADTEPAEALQAVADVLARTTRNFRDMGRAAWNEYRARAGATPT